MAGDYGRSRERGDTSSLGAVLDTLSRVLPHGDDIAFSPIPGAEPEELVPDHLYRIAMADHSGRPVTAQLYQGLGDLGGFLWEQDVRSLLRMNAIDHPALPTVVNGGHDRDEDVGWVLTASADYTLDDPAISQHLSANPVEAMRHLILLADALAILHSQGIVHRNLSPAAALVEEAVDSGLRVRLSRFEMSAIIHGILAGSAGRELGERVRQLQADAPDRTLVHHPPERLDTILGSPAADPENDRSDVFSLGVIAFGWFVTPPERHAPGTISATSEPSARRDRLRRWHRALLAAVTAAEGRLGLPPVLADVLRGMLDPSPGGRPTAAEVVTDLTRSFSAIVRDWQPVGRERLRLMYMPVEYRRTVFQWGWIANDPTQQPGQAELHEWLRNELHGARLVDSPFGAEPFVRSSDDANRHDLLKARHVLLGQSAAFFCTKYRPRSPIGGLGEEWDELLLIKYVVPHHQLRGRLTEHHFGHEGLDVELIVYGTARALLEAQRRAWPSWAPLLAAVRDSGARPAEEGTFTDALRWIVDYRRAETDAARFDFEVVEFDAGGDVNHRTVVLREDGRKRRAHLANDSLRGHIGHSMGALGDEMEDRAQRSRDGTSRLRVTGDNNVDVDYLDRLDAQTIRVRVDRRSSFPPHGVIETFDNWSDRRNLAREARAVHELIGTKSLVGQLRRPYTIRVLGKGLESAGKGLEGGADAVVRRLLTSYPFFALQGPPGTGKTTVAAHAISAQLRAEPTMRILVSAQSNGALDNLGVAVRTQLADTPVLMYRVQPRNVDVVDDRLSDLELPAVTEREIKRMSRAFEEIQRSNLNDRLRGILGEWRAALPESRVELARRVRDGAAIVLATTAKSTREELHDWGRFPAFDWVVIEEAAKAWPTELALPLVRGVRWTLIGDHKQLPAYRRDDFLRTLAGFAAGDRPGAEDVARRVDEIRDAFDLFGTLFARANAAGSVDSLRTQFRMRKVIADLVSSVFYATDQLDADGVPVGLLETHPTAEARRVDLAFPPALVDRPLAWVDTAGSGLVDEPAWRNPGEADLIARLVRTLRPAPDNGALVVLTPYLDQLRTLERLLPGVPVGTIHSHQGKEAAIVVVSLVRTTIRGSSATSNIGFLADPHITNVLLSRAKSLLVLVGDLQHFACSSDETWSLVTRLVGLKGAVVAHDAPSLGLSRS